MNTFKKLLTGGLVMAMGVLQAGKSLLFTDKPQLNLSRLHAPTAENSRSRPTSPTHGIVLLTPLIQKITTLETMLARANDTNSEYDLRLPIARTEEELATLREEFEQCFSASVQDLSRWGQNAPVAERNERIAFLGSKLQWVADEQVRAGLLAVLEQARGFWRLGDRASAPRSPRVCAIEGDLLSPRSDHNDSFCSLSSQDSN